MLLTPDDMHAIRKGTITLAFRRWKRPTVKVGSTLTNEMGVVAIDAVQVIARDDITDDDAQKAGHPSKEAVHTILDPIEGTFYRVELHFAGEDPRIALRENDTLTDEEIDEVLAGLARLDRAAKDGAWTTKVLRAIDAHPHVLAAVVARKVEMDKDVFKANVRKLKGKGLTESHERGYSLSPRGRKILRAVEARLVDEPGT